MAFELLDPPIVPATVLRKVCGLGTGLVELSLQLIDAPAVAPAVLCEVCRLSTCIDQLSLKLRDLEPAKCRVRIPLWSLVTFSAQFAFPGRGWPIAHSWAKLRRAHAARGSSSQARTACGTDLERITRAGTACGGGSLGYRPIRTARGADVAVTRTR